MSSLLASLKQGILLHDADHVCDVQRAQNSTRRSSLSPPCLLRDEQRHRDVFWRRCFPICLADGVRFGLTRKGSALLSVGLVLRPGLLGILQLVLAITFEYDFQVHGHSGDLVEAGGRHTAYPVTSEHCDLSEVVVYRRANIDVVIRPLGGRTGAVL